MGNSKDILNPVYGPDDLQAFTGILKIENFTAEQAHQLQRAAWTFEFMNYTDQMRATRAERRKALNCIHDAAQKLKGALKSYNQMMVDDKVDLPFSDVGLLDSLAGAAKKATDSILQSGPDPKQARRTFVQDLGRIFQDATGKRPTLRTPPGGRTYGPFLEFVKAALVKLDRYSVQGVERDATATAAKMKELDP